LRTASGLDEILKIAESDKSAAAAPSRQLNDVRSQFSDVSKVKFSTKQIVVQLTDNAR
jgi:hypothetical protein